MSLLTEIYLIILFNDINILNKLGISIVVIHGGGKKFKKN